MATWGRQTRFAGLVDDGWTFTQDRFERFGVDRIEVMNPPWAPKLPTLKATLVTLDGS